MDLYAGTLAQYLAEVQAEVDAARAVAQRRANALTDPSDQCHHGVSLYLTCWSCGVESGDVKPRFEHDCEGCTFLGPHLGRDLYWCIDTIIARRSDEGSDYISGMEFRDRNEHLAEAYRRAVQCGLITEEQ